jgi:hypothetical protein
MMRLLVPALLLSIAPGAALACSCRSAPGADIVADAQIIFDGVAGETYCEGLPLADAAADSCVVRGAVTTFSVTEVWKGADPVRMTVHHGLEPAACGVRFEAGQSYLVIAGRAQNNPDEVGTSECGTSAANDPTIRQKLIAWRESHPPSN